VEKQKISTQFWWGTSWKVVTCKKVTETGIYYQNRSWENNLPDVG